MARRFPTRERLYAEGKNDREIASAEGVKRPAILQWRQVRGLPPNTCATPRLSAPQHELRRTLYAEGVNDKRLARIVGVTHRQIYTWRLRRGLASCFVSKARMTLEQEPACREMIGQGMSDAVIAHCLDISVISVFRWRTRCGLRRPRPVRRARDNGKFDHQAARFRDGVLAAIFRQIPRWLAPDLRDDAGQEIYEALLRQQIDIGELSTKGVAIAKRVANEFASKFGPRSLDEVMHGTEDFRLIDALCDDRSSNWLEEMGATVW